MRLKSAQKERSFNVKNFENSNKNEIDRKK